MKTKPKLRARKIALKYHRQLPLALINRMKGHTP